jgi:hypothetical protein
LFSFFLPFSFLIDLSDKNVIFSEFQLNKEKKHDSIYYFESILINTMRAAPAFMLKGDKAAQKMASLQANTDQAQLAANMKAEEEEAKPQIPSQMVLRVEDLQSFYLSPYLSCAECNGITFINSEMLQKALIADIGGDSGGLLLEALPECAGCGRTYAYHIGAKDLSALIASNKRELAKKKARELAASILMQRRMRGVFARGEYARRQAAKHLFKRLLNRGATIIQTQYRGRLGRREGVAEASLAWIKNAHQKLLKLSLVNRFGLRKVFWFKSKSELKLLFLDYKLLCERLGNEPPVWSLEWNVGEIARRIYKLQCAYATRIQKIFRGLLGRNFIRLYRRERARLWRIQAAGTFIIQRTYRGWWSRMEYRRHREKVAKNKYMDLYMADQNLKKANARKSEQRRKLMQRYKKQRKEEVAAKYTGKSPFGAENGHKMKAFSLTEYGDNKVDVLTNQWTRQQKQEKFDQQKHVSDKFARIEYVRNKGKQFQPFETYFKPETQKRREEFMARIESLKERFSVIGPGKDWRDLINK